MLHNKKCTYNVVFFKHVHVCPHTFCQQWNSWKSAGVQWSGRKYHQERYHVACICFHRKIYHYGSGSSQFVERGVRSLVIFKGYLIYIAKYIYMWEQRYFHDHLLCLNACMTWSCTIRPRNQKKRERKKHQHSILLYIYNILSKYQSILMNHLVLVVVVNSCQCICTVIAQIHSPVIPWPVEICYFNTGNVDRMLNPWNNVTYFYVFSYSKSTMPS